MPGECNVNKLATDFSTIMTNSASNKEKQFWQMTNDHEINQIPHAYQKMH